MNHCETCHWWNDAMPEVEGRRLCVFLTGLGGSTVAPISGIELLVRTKGDFGCVKHEDRKP